MMKRAKSSVLDSSLDDSQALPIISDGCLGDGQQGFQLGLRQQVAFDLQEEALELRAVGSGHVGQSITGDGCCAVLNCTL